MRPLLNLLLLPSITLFVTASTIPNILLNPNPSPPSTPHSAPSTLPHNLTTTTIPTFLDTVISTVLKTTAKYPTATFRLVRVSSPTGPTTAFVDLTNIRIVFSIRDPTYKSLIVKMSHIWSIWHAPELSHEDVPSDMGVMRLNVRMDLVGAWSLIWERGFREVYESVVLYWPCLPPLPDKQEPFYRFRALGPNRGFFYVGAWSRNVTRELEAVGSGNSSTEGALDVV